MLKGRLGLDTSRVPHVDRHGLVWLERGELNVIDGCLHFSSGHYVDQAINHAATAVQAAAVIAVQALAAIPQLGFIHEDSGQALVLDIADLFRDDITLSIALAAVKETRAERSDC